jgi:signal transduction histidine kinase/HAMP domain-containing protein
MAIGALAALNLAVFVTLLVTLSGLRDSNRAAADLARVGVAGTGLETAVARLEASERGVVIVGADPAFVRSWHRDAAVLRASADMFAEIAGPPQRVLAADARAYLAGTSAPLVALAARDPAAARRHFQQGRSEQSAQALQDRLAALVVRERAAHAARRSDVNRLASRAWIAGLVGVVMTLICAAGFLAYVRRAILVPLRGVGTAARALAAGDLRARVAERGGGGEVGELAHTFDQMAVSLEDSRAALERRNAELARQSVELVEAVRSAREGASVLRAVLDATPDAIALLDPDGTVIVDNPPMRAIRRSFGTRATALDEHGRPGPLDVGDLRDERREEITLAGTRRAFARYAAPVHDGRGLPIGRLLVLREVTSEREAEHAKQDFFALVSHELRTPLTAILGYVELVLAEEQVDAQQHEHLAIVERNAQRLLRLVGDLLFAAQVERGALLLEPGAVDLPQLVRDAVALARPRAEDAGIALSAEIAPLPPCLGDGDRLAQVLDNVLSNALKFTSPKGRVDVRLTAQNGTARLEVADTGVGILDDELPRLFDRFYRATNATTRAVPGLGLGLMIARAIVEGHGGTIEVASTVGVGTTFAIAVPLRSAPKADEPLAADERYRAGGR